MESRKDFTAGLLFVALATAAGIGAWRFDIGTARHMGPGYFPLAVSAVLGVCGLILVVKSEKGLPGRVIPAAGLRPLFFVLLAVLLFAASLEYAGLLVAVPVLTIVSSFARRGSSLLGTLITAACLTCVAWAIFVVGLNLSINVTPWG